MATLKQKLNLFRGLMQSDRVYNSPFYVDVDVTNRCNLTCLGCKYHGPGSGAATTDHSGPADLPVPLFENLCADLRAMGTETLILQGQGEPLLHPRLFDLIAIAKQRNFHVTLLSNGTLLNDTTIEGLLDSGLDVLKVSLWATTPEEYQQNYPGNSPALFDRVTKGIAGLTARRGAIGQGRLKVLLYFVYNRHNHPSLGRAVQLAQDLACDGIYFSPLVVSDPASKADPLTEGEKEDIERSLRILKKRLRSLALEENIAWALLRQERDSPMWRRMPCYIAWFHVRVKVDGRVEPCGRCDRDIHFGNLNDSRFQDIWQGEAIQNFRGRALTKEGLQGLSDHCQCHNCCFFWDMENVHRVMKWVGPFRRQR